MHYFHQAMPLMHVMIDLVLPLIKEELHVPRGVIVTSDIASNSKPEGELHNGRDFCSVR